MNIKKYPTWMKWSKAQKDYEQALIVFSKSILLISKTPGLISNFNLDYHHIYQDLLLQKSLILEKFITSFLLKKLKIDHFDIETINLIKHISSLDSIDKSFIKRCFSITYSEISNVAKKEDFNIKRCLHNMYMQKTLTDVNSFLNWINYQDIKLNFSEKTYEVIYKKSNFAIIKIDNPALFSWIGSPSWCVTHKSIYSRYYTYSFDCYVLFENTDDGVCITGFNFTVGQELIHSIFDYFNKPCFTYNQTKYIKHIKSHMTKSDRFHQINKIKTNSANKIFKAWINNIKPSDMIEFYDTLVPDDINNVISIFQETCIKNTGLLEYLCELEKSKPELYMETLKLIKKDDSSKCNKLKKSLFYNENFGGICNI